MVFIVFGINYKIVLVVVCECVVFILEQMVEVLQQFCCLIISCEVVILLICNWSEFYLEIDYLIVDDVFVWLVDYYCLIFDELCVCVYVYQDEDVVCYMMCVVFGFDLMVFGELQIFGQMKLVYVVVCEVGIVGLLFGCLFQVIFSMVKIVCIDIVIGENLVFVVFVVVSLVKQIFSDLYCSQVLLIGVGEIIILVVCYLFE